MSNQTAYTLTFTDAGGAVPVAIRLRRLLKTALRVYGLRCTEAKEAEPTVRPVAPSNTAACEPAAGRGVLARGNGGSAEVLRRGS